MALTRDREHWDDDIAVCFKVSDDDDRGEVRVYADGDWMIHTEGGSHVILCPADMRTLMTEYLRLLHAKERKT